MIEQLLETRMLDRVVTTSDGLKFGIDQGKNLWLDVTGGHRTGVWNMGPKQVGVYLSHEQVKDIIAAYMNIQ